MKIKVITRNGKIERKLHDRIMFRDTTGELLFGGQVFYQGEFRPVLQHARTGGLSWVFCNHDLRVKEIIEG